jgi:hypothetical protein
VESRAALAALHVVRRTAPPSTIAERLRRREVGSGTAWYLGRVEALSRQWALDPFEDQLVETRDRSVEDIGREVLHRSGWL